MYFTVLCNRELKQFFFSMDHCQGVNALSEEWVPVTFRLPMNVVPRPGLEDGLVDTLNKYINVFHDDETEIPNPDPHYRPFYRDGHWLDDMVITS